MKASTGGKAPGYTTEMLYRDHCWFLNGNPEYRIYLRRCNNSSPMD